MEEREGGEDALHYRTTPDCSTALTDEGRTESEKPSWIGFQFAALQIGRATCGHGQTQRRTRIARMGWRREDVR